jgi:aldose sugar dehydrogenase
MKNHRAAAFIRLTKFSRPLLMLVLGILVMAFAISAQAQRQRRGSIADTYAQLCINCHGANLQGGQAQSLLDDVWVAGGDDESLARSIRNGFPEKGMPAWGQAIPEKEIRAMVIYIREQRERHQRGLLQFNKPADSITAKSQLHEYQVNTWIGGVKEPWSLAFLPGGKALLTEKTGGLLLVENGKLVESPIKGVPAVDSAGQAGLFDVVPHPNYASNGWIYLAFADPRSDDGNRRALTRIIRGRIREGTLADQQDIFRAAPEFYSRAAGVHYGGRIAFDQAGFPFFTIGERGNGANAQNLSVPMGKVHRVHDDGRIPADNPFVKDTSAQKTIWSYGHRNPQGLAIHPATGELFDLEHGPRGGDELNLVQKGRNYGWPVITYGMNYDGSAMTDLTAKEGMEQPVTYWVPSLAVCGMNFYVGDLFPKWKHQLFIATLAAEELLRLDVKNGKFVAQEVIFKGLGRIRHVIGGPDGALYALLPSRVVRITPVN